MAARRASRHLQRAHGHTDTRTHGHTDTRTTRTHGHMDTRTHGHTDTQTHGHTDTRTHGHTDTRTPGHPDTRTRGLTDTRTHGHTDTNSVCLCVFSHKKRLRSGSYVCQLARRHDFAPTLKISSMNSNNARTSLVCLPPMHDNSTFKVDSMNSINTSTSRKLTSRQEPSRIWRQVLP